jgi:hypothetical protein
MTGDQASVLVGLLSIVVYALGLVAGLMAGEWE